MQILTHPLLNINGILWSKSWNWRQIKTFPMFLYSQKWDFSVTFLSSSMWMEREEKMLCVYLEWLLGFRVAFIFSKWYTLIFLPFNLYIIEKSNPPTLTYARNHPRPSAPPMLILGDVRHHLKPPGPLLILTYGRHHQSHQRHQCSSVTKVTCNQV